MASAFARKLCPPRANEFVYIGGLPVTHPAMKYRIALSALCLVLQTVMTPELGAQKTYALGIAGGAAIPAGQLRETQTSGYNGTLSLAIGVAELPIGVRFDAIYDYFSRRDVVTPASAGIGGAYSMQTIGGLANLIYAFPGTSAKPYLIAGAGWYRIERKGDGTKPQSSIGYNGGVGSTFGFGPIAMFIESRYHSISRSAAKGGVVQFVPVTLGLMF
jgi:hypothetical protein